MTTGRRNCALFFAAIFAVTLALRLCQTDALWSDEDYHIAAGIQSLGGKLLYRDLWYDKPPLAAWIYAVLGALPGWPLRLFDAAYVLAICAAMWRFAADAFGRREALFAAGLMAFFLNFDLGSAVIPIASDFFLVLPHVVAVHCAWKGKPLAAGLWCGVGFLVHTKAVFVLAVCAMVAWPSLPLLAAGFTIPNALAVAGLAAGGALGEYYRQVWQWGAAYARSSPEGSPLANGVHRTADWLGFHAALLVGALGGRRKLWMGAWLVVAFAGVALGGRFFPRYFLLLLPPAVLLAAHGLAKAPRWVVGLAGVLLLVPLVRFAPHYFNPRNDVALDRDSQAAAAIVNARKHPGDTLFVWGYRPDVFVYTRMPVASRFWDSQPLTGVPADRHLHDATAVMATEAAENRREFARSKPEFVVDSLSLSNARLAIDRYSELGEWLAQYREVGRTRLSVVYERIR